VGTSAPKLSGALVKKANIEFLY